MNHAIRLERAFLSGVAKEVSYLAKKLKWSRNRLRKFHELGTQRLVLFLLYSSNRLQMFSYQLSVLFFVYSAHE